MVARRWPDVVIVVAFLAIAALGVWALWGEDLGLREAHDRTEPAPTRAAPDPAAPGA